MKHINDEFNMYSNDNSTRSATNGNRDKKQLENDSVFFRCIKKMKTFVKSFFDNNPRYPMLRKEMLFLYFSVIAVLYSIDILYGYHIKKIDNDYNGRVIYGVNTILNQEIDYMKDLLYNFYYSGLSYDNVLQSNSNANAMKNINDVESSMSLSDEDFLEYINSYKGTYSNLNEMAVITNVAEGLENLKVYYVSDNESKVTNIDSHEKESIHNFVESNREFSFFSSMDKSEYAKVFLGKKYRNVDGKVVGVVMTSFSYKSMLEKLEKLSKLIMPNNLLIEDMNGNIFYTIAGYDSSIYTDAEKIEEKFNKIIKQELIGEEDIFEESLTKWSYNKELNLKIILTEDIKKSTLLFDHVGYGKAAKIFIKSLLLIIFIMYVFLEDKKKYYKVVVASCIISLLFAIVLGHTGMKEYASSKDVKVAFLNALLLESEVAEELNQEVVTDFCYALSRIGLYKGFPIALDITNIHNTDDSKIDASNNSDSSTTSTTNTTNNIDDNNIFEKNISEFIKKFKNVVSLSIDVIDVNDDFGFTNGNGSTDNLDELKKQILTNSSENENKKITIEKKNDLNCLYSKTYSLTNGKEIVIKFTYKIDILDKLFDLSNELMVHEVKNSEYVYDINQKQRLENFSIDIMGNHIIFKDGKYQTFHEVETKEEKTYTMENIILKTIKNNNKIIGYIYVNPKNDHIQKAIFFDYNSIGYDREILFVDLIAIILSIFILYYLNNINKNIVSKEEDFKEDKDIEDKYNYLKYDITAYLGIGEMTNTNNLDDRNNNLYNNYKKIWNQKDYNVKLNVSNNISDSSNTNNTNDVEKLNTSTNSGNVYDENNLASLEDYMLYEEEQLKRVKKERFDKK